MNYREAKMFARAKGLDWERGSPQSLYDAIRVYEENEKMNELSLSLNCLGCKPKVAECVPQKQENNMDTLDMKQRSFLKDRTNQIYERHHAAAVKKFNLIDDEAPVTLDDLQERLAAGSYVYDKEQANFYKARGWYQTPLQFVRWRKGEADQAGYEAFLKQLGKDMQFVEEEVKIQDPKDSIKAVREFDAKVYN